MTKVQTEFLEDRQARLTVSVEPERVQQEMHEAARRIARQVNIPGFRKGKAPYRVIEQFYGEEAILEEALDPLGQAVYQEALEQSNLEPYAPGMLSDFTRDPFVMTFTVPLIPEVDLGNYRDVRVPFEAEVIGETEVEAALRELQEQNAALEPVERPIEMGSVAILDVVGTLVRPDTDEANVEKPGVWLNRADVRVKIAEDATYPVPGFPQRVVGMAEDDERSFDISFGAEDEEVAETLRGKTLHFEVKCHQVYQHTLPVLDDTFAQSQGDFQTLDDLRSDIRARLQRAAEERAKEQYADRVLAMLLESFVSVSYPPIMVEEQIDDLLEDFEDTLRRQGLSLEEYRRMSGQSDGSLRDELRERATRQVERALTLGKLSEAEHLAVSDTEIDDEIQTMMLSFGAEAGLVQQFLSAPEMRRRIASRLLAEKTVERLVLIARGEAPEIGADAVEETTPEGPDTAAPASEAADGTAPEPALGPEVPAAEQHSDADRE